MYDIATALESYTIPEYEIATEGLLQTIGSFIVKVLKAISAKIGVVIPIVIGLVVALKGKVSNKPASTESKVIPELTKALMPYTNEIRYISIISAKISNTVVSGVNEMVLMSKSQTPLSKEKMREVEKGISDDDIRAEFNELLDVKKQFETIYDELLSKKNAFLEVQRRYPNGKISTDRNLIEMAATAKKRLETMKKDVDYAIKQIFAVVNYQYQNASNRIKKAVSDLQKEIGTFSGLIGKFIPEITEYSNIVKKVI